MNRHYVAIDPCRTGQTIRKIMLMRGLTVKDVQKYLHLSTPQSIYHWFDGRNMPSVDNLYVLSELFQVPVDMMLKGNRREEFDFCRYPGGQRLFAYYDRCLELKAG